MGFFTRTFGLDAARDLTEGITSNTGGEFTWNAGDPDGFEIADADPGSEIEVRSIFPTPWDGWPTGWATSWDQGTSLGIRKLIDIAWTCIDLNASIISAMPVYEMSNGAVISPETWMRNPDPTVYNSWNDFAKELFWDYQMGEAFVLPMATNYDNTPRAFRVIPPYLVNAELIGGIRQYSIGGRDVTDMILHIRYQSNVADARGHGPLEAAGAKIIAIGLLQRYADRLAQTGGVPQYWIGTKRKLTPSEGKDLLETWIETRAKNAGYPAILGSDASLNESKSMSAQEMALMEMQQFNESRIAVMLGVPPFLVGLAPSSGGGGGLTYSNISDLFDFHDRSSLRPKTASVMAALSNWALPGGRTIELNRDDYTRLPFDQRMAAYALAIQWGILTAQQVQVMERYVGIAATAALTGGST